MLEKSVAAAQSSKPSQMATEWAGPGQAAKRIEKIRSIHVLENKSVIFFFTALTASR